MVKNIVAKRYSKVLVESYPKRKLKGFQKTIKNLTDFFQSEPSIKEFITSPAVNRKHKLEILDLMAEKLKLDNKMNNFFKLLVENNRIFFMDEIFTEIINTIHSALNINYFQLETARKLNDKTLNKIKKYVKQYVPGTIKFEHRINKNLIGGFFVYNNDLALNGSIKNNFENFVKEL